MKARHMSLLMLLIAFASGAAFAGFTQPQSVVVDLVNRSAIGDMVTARFSENDVELIGCGVRYFDDGAGGAIFIGFCSAADADDNQIICFTENAGLIEAIKAISDYSFITFGWDADNQCTAIGNSTQSFYLPNLKAKK